MLDQIRPFFDHSRHSLSVDGLDAALDVLAFEGTEALSQTFRYRIEVTSTQLDIAAQDVLGKDASFSLRAAPESLGLRGYTPPAVAPLRTLHGVVTRFKRLSASRDEARYEVTLEPRLALLDHGCQYRIYQNQSVPEIVDAILRRHGLRGQDFLLDLGRTYAQHEQLLQYGESDLAYLQRLCAERGIWYRFSMDARLKIDVVEFHDSPMHYQRDIALPLRPQSGTQSSGQDAVWDLQASHQVVPQQVSNRAYYSRDAGANLDGQADLAHGATTTYGEAYHYADEPYQTLGDPLARDDEEGHAESGVFYAQLAHERYLNDQLRLDGASSSAALAPGQVLEVQGGAPAAFAQGALIVRLHSKAARDRSYEIRFEAIPDSDTVAFRPAVPAKPRIAGTVPARVTSPQRNDPYGHIDGEGRYRVNFLFDRDAWPAGRESMWLRLARPYAGDTHGLHLPLLAGTEVAVAFEQGDPDRPFIAHALHDSLHPDHVTIHNYKRNVLRTPANNKLRMDDTRGQEHIKLSTEYSGKSQLNLGHLVDGQRQKRGEGFELRTDGWGAVRAGKGLFISADEQVRAGGQVLAMQPAESLLEGAVNQMERRAEIAQAHHNLAPDRESLRRLQADATQLKAPAILLSAPNGIGAVSPQPILLDSAQALYLQSAGEVNLASEDRLHANSRQAMTLLAQEEGMRLVSGKGPLNLESHADALSVIAQQDITVQSTQGHLQITAKQGITLASGGAYIRLTPDGKVEVHGPSMLSLKGQHRLTRPTSQEFPLPELPTSVCKDCLRKAQAQAMGYVLREP
ncbi:type VI secretion system secreted protein VgrG [Pseudomonas delhiensis]|uniref:Type VI secretion system secreted protein VgrG n=1 Tax=Pseudomonas delhiensis TaxID=366289 RepID=A0A1G8TBN5_9PSED|nr:type VI secretion system Vgr family protein [Pseudomonas delhiensis]SDJ38804.1 type VI secretion system secreted protein VgrG [Pseudomonas delhiensis]